MREASADFTPPVPPETMLTEPEAASTILRQALAWLGENALHLAPDKQRALAGEVGIRSGLYAAEFPAEYGGWSIPERVAADLREEAAATGWWFSRFILSNFHGPSRLLMAATPDQRERWLRPLVEGRWTRCLAITEEQAGSDLSTMRTTATESVRGWVLRGRKFGVGNAADADVAIVLANAVSARATGPTFFIFRTDDPGWKVLRRLPGMDPMCELYEVALDSIELTDAAIIGGPGGIAGGIGKISEWMTYGRVALAARAVGLSRFALNVARRHADQRLIGGVKLSGKQYIREFIVRSSLKIEASRCLVRQAATALDGGSLAIREVAMAKLHATESACEIVDDAMQVLGLRGWISQYGLEQVYREVRGYRIADGASELLKETVFHLLPPTEPRTGVTRART